LIFSYQDTKYCSFIDDTGLCAREKTVHRFRSPLSLFQNIGIYSSLKNKTQKWTDKSFGKYIKSYKLHQNPSVSSITSTLEDYRKYILISCYAGQNFFWTLKTEKDDTIEFLYNPPLLLSK
jgi:hypothetical protein